MNRLNFDKWFRGFHYVGCAVRSREFLYLLGRREYEVDDDGSHPDEYAIDKRVINILLDEPPDDRSGSSTLTGFGVCNIAACAYPKPHGVVVDYGGQVYVRGSELTGMESEPPFDETKGPSRGSTVKLRTIGGYVYAVGSPRNVIRRKGPNQWAQMWDDTLPHPKVKRKPDYNRFGFEAIDGFSTEDLYVAGGDGDIWNFSQGRWRQIAFPSNVPLQNLCCGADGQVYVAGQGGEIYRGRGNTWTKIHDGGISLPINDMVWFQDQVWCTNDSGIWTIQNDQVMRADVPDFVRSCAGYASAADGVLLVAGMYGAALHDGQQWNSLVDLPALYEKYGAD